jgi:hypothetical protein
MFFGAENQSGSYQAGTYAPVTIDEVRLWTTARSQQDVRDWMEREYADKNDSNLVGYWRFNAEDKELDETGRADVAFSADGDLPKWSYGLVYPTDAPRMLLAAPLARPMPSSEVRSADTLWDREILVSTHTDQFSVVGDSWAHLQALTNPGYPAPYDWCHYRNFLIFCNGLHQFKYDGAQLPHLLSLAQPAAAVTATPTGAGSGWGAAGAGVFQYQYSYRNSKDGTESLVSAAVSATMTATHDTCELTSFSETYLDNRDADQIRIYRTVADGSTFRYLADVDLTTPVSYSDTGGDNSSNDALDTNRGEAEVHRYCAVYANRVFLFNSNTYPSGVRYSEADSHGDFTATNLIQVDRGDGDEGTGIISAFGGLVLFKQYSIHFLTGEGDTTFAVRKVVAGQGCVSARTIAESPNGIYFLSHDGVYRLTPSLIVEPVSFNQQSEFEKIDPETYRFASAVYDPIRHQYLISSDFAERGPGSYYDKDSGLFSNYYKFASDATDETENNDLTASGSPAYVVDSQRGTCIQLDGTDDKLISTDITTPTESYTYGYWINFHGPAAAYSAYTMGIASSTDDNWELADVFNFVSGVLGYFKINSGSAFNTQTSIPYSPMLNRWFHVVTTGDGIEFKTYLNGKLGQIKSFGGTPLWTTTDSQIHIGKIPNESGFLKARVQNVFYIADTGISDQMVQEIYEYEAQQMYLWQAPATFAYDEESNTWAKWDRHFDQLELARHSANRAEVIGAKRGFIYRLFESQADGSAALSGGPVPTSGSVTSLNASTLTDATALFPTIGDGLAGCEVLLEPTSGSDQKRNILSNTATSLYLDRIVQPAVTGTYYIAPIDWYWESRWMDMGDPFIAKRWQMFHVWQVQYADADTITFKYKTEDNETWVSTSFTNSDEFKNFQIENRGRKLKIRFSNRFPNQDANIQAFQSIFVAFRRL